MQIPKEEFIQIEHKQKGVINFLETQLKMHKELLIIIEKYNKAPNQVLLKEFEIMLVKLHSHVDIAKIKAGV